MGVIDLEKHFAFYGAYHSNKINVLIHTIFVWPIFFTLLILESFTPSIGLLPFPPGTLPFQEFMVLNLSFVTAIVYGLFYVLLDKKAGTIAGVLCLICWISSNALAQRLGFSLAWKVILVSQLVCWTGQCIGHGVFEKRAPALMDNLVQAILMAPFFVLLEALQKFYNYEPYPGFEKSVRTKVQANIKELRMKKQKKSA
ncbi:hypothetical protein SUGI_1070770 [Cryptomeria japonica]|uniref:2-hydroxy-palmitic acid dioxygenase mpo1 n=1 Tax=Cryptomeria japonica TaxID=3369 RepID=UPI002414CFF1|nr:2-hydroxy-palmitic acid dioxygenase mpo1 [Cryptomeria japonica]XP_057865779.2 2-hydroxy-palmitic acid dioxygenase mpo1 [Cryptomeria japonica]GLJ50279.1 hypothetical protein SUGI_1070770 [Cryptomeria japonica]